MADEVIYCDTLRGEQILVKFYNEWFNGYFSVRKEHRIFMKPFLERDDFLDYSDEDHLGWSACHSGVVCMYKGRLYGDKDSRNVKLYTEKDAIEETERRCESFMNFAIAKRQELAEKMHCTSDNPLLDEILEWIDDLFGGDDA